MRRNEKTAQDLLNTAQQATRVGQPGHQQGAQSFVALIEKALADADHPLLQVIGTIELKGYHRGYTAGIKVRQEARGPDFDPTDLDDAIKRLEHLIGQMRNLTS